jgi:hypothetical protein
MARSSITDKRKIYSIYEPNLFSGYFPKAVQARRPEDVFLVKEEVDVEYESTDYYKLLEIDNARLCKVSIGEFGGDHFAQAGGRRASKRDSRRRH